ncbi:hypothetical protein [Eleftheria terrae]|uniref:hypothetical protein n=1 Tax=Eleftheria terrae TaxID=1597781 RepID=UPI00263A9AC1|nr:hypothetical protein [Eleftheria terrae]WKB51579.1 hypothetical protein N7L95_17480 [Eleftheria terrae]
MPKYEKIPPLDQWLADCVSEIGRLPADSKEVAEFGALAKQDHVLATIADLLDDYDLLRPADKGSKQFRKHVIVMYLHEATTFWLAKGDRIPKTAVSRDAAGPRFRRLDQQAVSAAVTALRDVAQVKLRKYYRWVDEGDLAGIRKALVTKNPIGVSNTEEADDERRRREGGMVWLSEDKDRIAYKLRFRGGLAYRTLRPESGLVDPEFCLLSTAEHDTERGRGAAHFVMDERGRIYCGYDRQRARAFKFFHSSLVAGAPALAAGMMRIDKGQVTQIMNASGHYRPTGRHMASVLQRLRLYAVDLSEVTVVNQTDLRTYSAADVLAWNGWPEGHS